MILEVGSFQYKGATYNRFYDTSTSNAFVQVTGSPEHTNIPPTAHGETQGGQVIGSQGQQCVGTDKYTFYTQAQKPFFYASKQANGCTAPPECDLEIINITTLPETYIGGNNGQVTIEAETSGDYRYYSIDGVNYSEYNVFLHLSPGNYTAYVKDEKGCSATQGFTIDAYAPKMGCTDPAATNYDPTAQQNDGSCVYPQPNPPADTIGNLYEDPDEFRLIDNTGTYTIDEPKDWDKITVVLSRDSKYHGVNYQFTDGDIKLRFDDVAGRQILQSNYDKYGNDADVKLQFGKDRFGIFDIDFDGYVDFNSFEKQEDYVMVGVKRKTFNDLLETRSDTLVSLTERKIDLPLHSKLIRKATLVNTGAKGGTTQTLPINDWQGAAFSGDAPYLSYWSYVDFSGASQNDLCTEAPLFGMYSNDPFTTKQYIFKTDGGGTFSFNIQFLISQHFKINQKPICIGTGPRHGYWTYKWYLAVNNMASAIELPGSTSGFRNDRWNDFGYGTNYTTQLTLNEGDEVYLFGQYICEKRGCVQDFQFSTDQVNQNIAISGDTLATASTATSYMIFEAAEAVMKEVTDGQAYLKSDLLGRTDIGYSQDGCAALLALTNGYQIRGFDIVNRPIQMSFKQLIDGLNCTYGIGLSYELDNLNNYYARIEKLDYFYKDVELLVFSEVSDYVEDIDTSIVYNEIEIGYKKFTNNLPSSQNTLDEFCTLHDYLAPIKSFKQKMSLQCDWIASGYAIELTRRLKFAETPEDSWTYDEDTFVISTVRNGQSFKSEKTENFTASGIIGADTAYNIRLSPKRMLDRWAKWFNSAFAHKLPSDVLKNTFVAKNGDLTSALITPDGCDSLQTFTESSDLTLGNYHAFNKIFYPTKITFKKRISWDTMRYLRRQFESGNNGYISVVDCDGVTQQGYLLELSYNPESELANFTLRKKYVDLSTPFDCTVYSADTFGEFEAATGLPAEIEQCLFQNFA